MILLRSETESYDDRGVSTAADDQHRAADGGELLGRVEGIVGVGIDAEDSDVHVSTADIWAEQPGDGAAQPGEPRKEPRPELRPVGAPPACQEVIDRTALARLHVRGDAMSREPEHGTSDEFRVAAREHGGTLGPARAEIVPSSRQPTIL